jgi:glycosyltransferase involved in cell wall biosynthesis
VLTRKEDAARSLLTRTLPMTTADARPRNPTLVLPVSVVIATRNRADLVGDAVDSILDGDAIPAEIVVVDQSDRGPVMPALSLRRGCSVRCLRTSETGVSRGRNYGARAARQAIVAFTDDDILVSSGWLSALVGALGGGAYNQVVTGRVLPGAAEVAGSFVPASVRRTVPARYIGRIGRDVLAGGNMALRTAYFNSLGQFDVNLGAGSRFPAAEDNDFGFRVLENGGVVRFVPDAVVCHRAWRNSAEYVPLRYAYGRGKGGFYMKHLSLRDAYMSGRLVRDIVTRLARSARYCGDPRRAIGELAYVAGVVFGALTWLTTRSRMLSSVGVGYGGTPSSGVNLDSVHEVASK